MQALPLLNPAPYAVGVNAKYYNHGQTLSFKMQQKAISLSGGDYTITGVMDQNPHFRVKGKAFSFHGRKSFMDAQGQELFEIHNEIMHLHTTFVARQTGTKRELFRVVEKIMTFHDDMTVKLWNEATDRHEELVVRGDWLDRSAEIRLGRGGAILASISRNYWTMKQFLTDASTYAIHIAPGVDVSVMIALCICLDEVHDSKGTFAVAL